MKPCFYQDIPVEIPADFQKTVSTMYYLWMGEPLAEPEGRVAGGGRGTCVLPASERCCSGRVVVIAWCPGLGG